MKIYILGFKWNLTSPFLDRTVWFSFEVWVVNLNQASSFWDYLNHSTWILVPWRCPVQIYVKLLRCAKMSLWAVGEKSVCVQVAARSGKRRTLDKQTAQKISCHPLYQIERHSCVYVKEEGVNASSKTIAMFGSLFYYQRKIHKPSLYHLIHFQWPWEVCSLRGKHQIPSLPWVKARLPTFTPFTYQNSEQALSPKVLPRSNFWSMLSKGGPLHHFPDWPTESLGSLLNTSVLRSRPH